MIEENSLIDEKKSKAYSYLIYAGAAASFVLSGGSLYFICIAFPDIIYHIPGTFVVAGECAILGASTVLNYAAFRECKQLFWRESQYDIEELDNESAIDLDVIINSDSYNIYS